MNIEDLTLKQIRELQALVGGGDGSGDGSVAILARLYPSALAAKEG